MASMLPEDLGGLTISFDGKTICSTDAMECYENPLHIVSAQIAELGLTYGQETVDGKSNEIPAMQRLVKMLKLKGAIVVADALNCQKDTAAAIIGQDADYLLNVKDNQKLLKEDIENYVQDKQLRKQMDTAETLEKSRGRVERRTAFATGDIGWIEDKDAWINLSCIGAVHTVFTEKSKKSDEWHYYISSRKLSAEELLKHARAEWSVETMHWLLDVHFAEDSCRVQDRNLLQNLNVVRKAVINSIRIYKTATNSKRPFTAFMMDCLIDPAFILDILQTQN